MDLDKYVTRLKRLLVPDGGLLARTVKSGFWMGATNVGDRVLQIVLLIVLARLLDPRDFGLMGIALVTLSTLQHLSNLGVEEALIQQADDDVDEYLDTVLSLEVARGFVMTAGVFAAAPYVAGFFGEPRATDLIRVVAFSPLISGFVNPGVVYFQKDLAFHKQFAYRMSGSVARFSVGVGYALVSPTVWALAVSYLAANVVRLVVSYLAHDYRPWFEFRLDLVRELIDYGKWITGSSILYFLYSQGDDVVVGWLLSATALGFYQTAYQLANAPGTEITGVISRVTFPSFSKLQNDMVALREAFFRTVQLATFLAFPAAVGIAAVAPVFVEAFMGEQWLPMVPAMQILAGYGILHSFTATFSPVWKALGRPDYGTKLSVVRVVCIATLIYPMTNTFGIEGAALTVVGVYVFPMLPLDTYLVVNLVDTSYRRLAREAAYPAAASAVMGVAVVGVRQEITVAPIVEFVALVAVGVVTYLGCVAVMATQSSWSIDRNVRSLLDAVG